MFVSIGEAALIISVSTSTLRRWEREEHLKPDFRTIGGHRRYSVQRLRAFLGQGQALGSEGVVVSYGRVSSADQKEDLVRQMARLNDYCQEHFSGHIAIEDLGSGLNFKKRGLNRLLKLILSGSVRVLVLTHRDRLLRFGSELIFRICQSTGTEVRIIEEEMKVSDEQQLAYDVVEIMTVFSAKLYGKRSAQNRKNRLARQP